MTTPRQRFPWPLHRRVIREGIWAFDLDDGTGDGSPSLTKLLAFTYGVLAALSIPLGWPITGTQITLASVSISAAFGRGMWKHWLSRGSWATKASDTTERKTVSIIAERRDTGEGVEPTE